MKLSKLFVLSMFLLFSIVSHAEVYKLVDTKHRTAADVTILDNLKSGDEVIAKFHISEIDISDAKDQFSLAGTFKKLQFKELKLTSQVGSPALPYYSLIVKGYPKDFKIISQTGLKKDFVDILPFPAQKQKSRCGCEARDDGPLDINWGQYFIKNSKLHKVEYVGKFRNIPLTRILFYPSRLLSDENILRIYPDVIFRVSRVDDQIVESFKNVEDIIRTGDTNSTLLIVSPSKFISALDNLVDWKRRIGYQVDVVTLESVGTKYKEIKKFFHDRYKNSKTRYTYALIVGHEKNFPTNYAATDMHYRTPSDLSYFTMDNGPYEDDDFIPEVLYGRLVADTIKDVKRQIEKIIEYEKGLFDDPSGLERHIGLASNEGSNPSDVKYVQTMLKPFIDNFKVEPFYFFQANNDSTPENINEVWSKGVAWINYVGHGSGTSWMSQHKSYEVENIDDIIPNSVKPVVIDVACKNGIFKYGKYFGERLINAVKDGVPSGAVAYYGGTVNITWHPPAIMAIGIQKMVVEKRLKHLGNALLAGQMYLYNNFSNKDEVKDNFTWYQLQGDPTLLLRIGELKDIDVKINGNSLEIDIKSKIKVVFQDGKGNYKSVFANNGKVIIPEGSRNYSILASGYKFLEGTL